MGKRVLRPQPGAQTSFLSSGSDITCYGGASGGGKSFGLLLAALRHIDKPEHKAIIFRKTSVMLRNAGSIFDEAKSLYLSLKATLNESNMVFRFPSGATIQFAHLSDTTKRYGHQGAQYSFVGFDELTHFQLDDFVYLLSRLRNPSIKPQCYATFNPDSSSFVKDIIMPFLDDNQRFADLEKCSKQIYVSFGGDNNQILFSNEPKENYLSLKFIPACLDDNQVLVDKDPTYRQKLESLPSIERAQLLHGDWSISYSAGNVFRREYFIPFDSNLVFSGQMCIGVDLAATTPSVKNKDPDYSSITLMQKNGYNYYILNHWKTRGEAGTIYNWMQNICTDCLRLAHHRGSNLTMVMEQEPGSASKREQLTLREKLPLVNIEFVPSQGSKLVRARPLSNAAEKGNIYIAKGIWNESFLKELEAFPTQGIHDDAVDSTSIAFSSLSKFRF